MSVKIAIESPADEVEAALSIMDSVLELVYVERNHWDIPAPTVRVTVEARPPQPKTTVQGVTNEQHHTVQTERTRSK